MSLRGIHLIARIASPRARSGLLRYVRATIIRAMAATNGGSPTPDARTFNCDARPTRRADLVCVLAILGAALLLHSPGLARGRVLLPADVVLLMRPWGASAAERFPDFRFTQNQMLGPIFEYYSWRFTARERIRAGEIPLWNPMELSGNVLLGNSQSAVLYPPNVLLYLLPLWLGINLVTLLHTVVTGLLMYGLCRALRLQPIAAVTGALVWMLCGLQVVWTEFQTPTAVLCWLPGALWAWEFARRSGRTALGLCGVSGALALSFVAGHPQFAMYVAGMTALYILWRTPRKALWAVPISLLAAFLLGASTLLPVAEASRINHRRGIRTYGESIRLRLPPAYLGGLLLPNALGNPRDYVEVEDGVARPGNPYIGAYDFIEYTHYVGIGALVLVMLALLWRFNMPEVRFFSTMGLIGIALALGTPVGLILFRLVPGYAQFQAPARALCMVSFAFAALAAQGLEAALARKDASALADEDAAAGQKTGTTVRPADIADGYVVAGITAGLALVAALVWPLASIAYPALRTSGWIAYEASGIRHAVLVSALTGAALWSIRMRPSRDLWNRLAPVMVPVICAVDLLIWSHGFNPATDPRMLGGATQTTQALLASPSSRVLSLEDRTLGLKGLIVPNYNAVVGYREVQGADSVHSRRYHLAMETVAETLSTSRPVFPDGNTVRLPGADHPLLDALNVAHITTASSNGLPDGRFEPQADAELTVWRNPRAQGPAWLATAIQTVDGPVSAVRAMTAPSFQADRDATVEVRAGDAAAADAAARLSAAPLGGIDPGSVRLSRMSSHTMTYAIRARRRSLLVTSEPAYPGWRAYITDKNGTRPTPILIADGVLRAVEAPAGASTIEMRYAPGSWMVGGFLTCMAIGALVAALAGGRILARR